MSTASGVAAVALGFLVAVITTPIGVSGAVFLLPVQLDVLRVPSPSVTPTNLLFNVISVPGALLRHRRTGTLTGPLTMLLITGTLPGVVLGTLIRIHLAPGDRAFRLLAAALFLPLGIWLCLRRRPRSGPERVVASPLVVAVGVVAGTVGGVYGIGGGSLIGPVLVGAGLTVATVAPAALTATFLTSVAGVATYAVASITAEGTVAPDWPTGLLCGLGGLVGGYVGARLQPHIPDAALRVTLGVLAIGLAAAYLLRAIGV